MVAGSPAAPGMSLALDAACSRAAITTQAAGNTGRGTEVEGAFHMHITRERGWEPGADRLAEVVITGGLGFIGSRLTEALLQRGAKVHVIDDRSGARRQLPACFAANPRLAVSHESVLDRDAMARLLSGSLVFHLASIVGVQRVLEMPQLARRVAAQGSQHVLDLCAERRIPCVMFSSSEVYGPDRDDLLAEGSDGAALPDDDPRFAYAAGKRRAESVAHALAREAGLEVLILRPFNVAGPGQEPDSGMVLARFCDRALRHEPLIVHGDGRQTRCFLHVDDFVAITLELAGGRGAFGRTVNVGSDDEVAIEDAARRVIELSGSRSRIERVPYATVFGAGHRDFRRRRPDLTVLRSLTTSRPLGGLDRIITDALASMRARCEPELMRAGG